MKVSFRDSFAKDLAAITDQSLLRRIRQAIERVEQAKTLQDIANLKRLEAKGKYDLARLARDSKRIPFAPFATKAGSPIGAIGVFTCCEGVERLEPRTLVTP